MVGFLRLRASNIVINTAKIVYIETFPTAHYIYTNIHEVRGWHFFSFGGMHGNHHPISVHKEQHPEDYQVVSQWIDSNH